MRENCNPPPENGGREKERTTSNIHSELIKVSPSVPYTGSGEISLETITKISDEYNVSYTGFMGYMHDFPFEESNVKEVLLSCTWILDNCKPQKNINRYVGSYYLKHCVERFYGTYISNGAFIVAGILLGYRFEKYNNVNARFNMKFRKGSV